MLLLPIGELSFKVSVFVLDAGAFKLNRAANKYSVSNNINMK